MWPLPGFLLMLPLQRFIWVSYNYSHCTPTKRWEPFTHIYSNWQASMHERDFHLKTKLLNLPLQSPSSAASLLLELLYFNLSVTFKSCSETRRECLLWSRAVSISLINKTQQYGAVTRMQMSPDGECKCVFYREEMPTGARIKPLAMRCWPVLHRWPRRKEGERG